MGAVASIGRNNDELVDYLLDTSYVRTKKVELVFRAVDRANYILPSQRESTYKDLAWKHGNLHLSAPCVYGVAMEYLALRPGQSFLNIGSGTGYFSTMAGLLLGTYGVNHGIELHEDCVQYARERLEHFKQNSQALEEFEFCEPSFVQGNCLRVEPTKEYDAVYCGAAVPQNNIAAIKRFVRVGGIVVMPFKGRLCCFTRISESGWTCRKALGVSFATLVIPDPADQSVVTLPDFEPLSLQELCRSRVRQILRENIWVDQPDLKGRNLSAQNREPRPISSLEESDDWVSNEEDEVEDDEDLDNEDDDVTDADFIGRTRFLFNMEVDSNDPLYLRRVAMVMQQRNALNEQRNPLEEPCVGVEPLDRISEERIGGETAAAGGENGAQNAGASPSFTLDLSSDESPERNAVRADRERTRRSEERRARFRESESDTDSETDSDKERGEKRECPPGFRKLGPRREGYNQLEEMIHNACNQSFDDTDEGMDVDISSVAIRDTFQRVWGERGVENSIADQPAAENPNVSRNAVESNLFVNCMKEKIRLLPLPTTLKLYVNHNRSL